MATEMNLTPAIQKQIPPEFHPLIEEAERLAEQNNQAVALVGGIVRDLILGQPVLDVDIVVDPPARKIVDGVADLCQGKVVSHEPFLTFTIHLPSHHRFDLATAREEFYEKPARLPVVKPSSIQNDLKRRDFSINAIACWLNKKKWGTVFDPLGGSSDIQHKIIRVLHPKSFEDDPTRIFRAARFAGRFGFSLDRKTQGLLFDAVKSCFPKLLTPARLRHEFELIMKEENPLPALELLNEWGCIPFFHPDWRLLPEHEERLPRISSRSFIGSSDKTSLLVPRLVSWFMPWGEEKAQDMMTALVFEKVIKKEVLTQLKRRRP